MLFRILADIVILTHFLWILFLFLGTIWGVKNNVIKIVHLSGLLFAILIQVFGWYCPLTHLEFWLRSKQDPALAYAGSFMIHYAEKLVYLELSGTMVFVLTIILGVFNLWMYLGSRLAKTSREC
jgi:hypothetical protein